MLYFNNEFKNKYIESLNKGYVVPAQEYFNQSAKFEEKMGKDIALFDKAEWFEFLQSINIITLNKAKQFYAFFATYAKAYISKNSPDSENFYQTITDEDLVEYTSNVVNKEMCIQRDMMLTLVNEIPSPIDQYMVLAIYEGIKGENFTDITMLREEDIDTENNEFHLASGRVVKVSQELVNIALKASAQTVYVTPQSPLSNKTTSAVNLGESEYVFKIRNNSQTKTAVNNPKRIYDKFLRLKNFFENTEFDVPRVLNSGYVCGLQKILKENDKQYLREIADLPETKELSDRYGFNSKNFKHVTLRLKRTNFIS